MDGKLQTPETLQAAIEFFANPDNCHAYMVQMRWPNGVVTCPTCNNPNPRYLAKQRRFECRKSHPRKQFSVKVGTIFEDSPIPLKSWLLAVWQITNCKNGISSYELARALGVTQKTAWFMNHRIRLAMQDNDGGTLGGEVEIDETYIGGKARNMNAQARRRALEGKGLKNAWEGKVPVLGLLERHGNGKSKVRTIPVEKVRKSTLQPEVMKRVEDGSTIYTDALKSYDRLDVYYSTK
jgi:transposase-like protein